MPPCHGGDRQFKSDPGRQRGSSSVVEHNLAKVGVAGSSPVFRSICRHSQAVRQRSAKPLSPVRFWVPPPYFFKVTCRGGGTGRRKGLKIPRIVRFVPVRFRSSAPIKNQTGWSFVLRPFSFIKTFIRGNYHGKKRKKDQCDENSG